MAFGSVQLIPGVNVERTPTLLKAGVSESQLIRYKNGLVQKYGGWTKFYPFALSGVPRGMHAWRDLHGSSRLAVSTTTQVAVINSGNYQDVTPQVLTSNFAPNISTVATSTQVEITDPNISNVTSFDAVFFNTPVSQGGLILDGLYPILESTGTHSYKITVPTAASTSETNPTATNAGTLAGSNTLNFASVPSWVVAGMVVGNVTTPASIPASTTVSSVTATTVVLSQNVVSPGVGSGDTIVFSSIPVFTTTSGNSSVLCTFIGHGLAVVDKVNFVTSTTGNGVTIDNDYTVATVPNADTFTFTASAQATASGSFAMNGGEAQIVYYIALGPPALGQGYGLGNYGEGGYGTGVSVSEQTGTDLAADDWSLDNWGEILIECPENGPVFYWGPTTGFSNASIITTAPVFNSGAFVSQAEQILITYGSSIPLGFGYQQQPMLVQWCDVGNFFQWNATSATQAGNYTIPIGSEIVGGMAVANQNLIWTDIDLWSMAYVGYPYTFGFNKIGAGAGLVSRKAAQQLRDGVYWMGKSNFYVYDGGGVRVVPCPVWDFVFQNLNTSYLKNIRSMPNTPFDEAGWLFPSANSSSGECDSYVKMNITEPGAPWDYGSLSRSAWIDQSVLGQSPIGATPAGIIYSQESGNDADGVPMTPSFTTGYFYIAEGEDFAFVDQILPDFKWGTYSGMPDAQVQLTFEVISFMGDTPAVYGPYPVTSSTEYLSVRMRGRQMRITVSGNDLGSFWRLGLVRYRYSATGRR